MAQPLVADNATLEKPLRDVLIKARTSWLKNTEVVDILQNYKHYHFRVCRDPPDKPAGGTLFLFNRKAVRFFRKDGHNWRKKADGKTVRETHEKLKVGNREMLNCYYAHSELKDALQRRCYWLLDGEDHIVLVHYLSSNAALRTVQSSGATQMRTSESVHRLRDPKGMARISGENMTTASSAPDQIREEVQTMQFVVTTGESHLLAGGEPVDDSCRANESGREPSPSTAATFTHDPYQGHLINARLSPAWVDAMAEGEPQPDSIDFAEELVQQERKFARAASTPVLPSSVGNSMKRPMHGIPPNTFDLFRMLGPLHSAPSFEAGTVQTGSTMDADSLQQMKVQIRLKKADSRHSSLSAASDLPYPSHPHRTASENLGLDRGAKRQREADFGPTAAEDMLRRDSEPVETHFELKPAMSLTRMDSDTLQNAPTLARATSGPASMRCTTALPDVAPVPGCLPLPSTWASPFYAAAFAGYSRNDEDINRRPLSFCHLLDRKPQDKTSGAEKQASAGARSQSITDTENTAASSSDSRRINPRLSSPFGGSRFEPVELSELRPAVGAGQLGNTEPAVGARQPGDAEPAVSPLELPALNWLIASGRRREMSAGYPASTFVLPSNPGGARAQPVSSHLRPIMSHPSRNEVFGTADSPSGLALPDIEASLLHIESPGGLTLPMDSWEFSFNGLN